MAEIAVNASTAATARRGSERLLMIQIEAAAKNRYMQAMESKFRCIGAHIFVLQDHYRLPARFFACVSGALNSRLR
ncbi:hypothetical protein FHT80_004108 [Rhizobium sp. BK226]|nr:MULTISPECIES: hypothetical protein [Rhizobium]MBB4114750.1 hypothetical protein [Rhizobium sp. BK226]MBB4218186.1 hypothetical protein [Rhizobium sp. BK212]